MGINIVIVVSSQLSEFITGIRERMQVKDYKTKIMNKIASRKAICDMCDHKHHHYKEQVSIFEAI